MKTLDIAGGLTYLGLAGVVIALVLNLFTAVLQSILFGAWGVDVIKGRMTGAPIAAQVGQGDMSPALEIHQWLAYKAARSQNDEETNYHVEQALVLATNPKHRSELDGLLREHLPSGHFPHVWQTLKDWLGAKPVPELSPRQLEAQLALALYQERRMDDARAQVKHFVGLDKEMATGEKILEALTKVDLEEAIRLLAELAGTP